MKKTPPTLSSRLDTPWTTVLLVALFFGGFLFCYFQHRHNFNSSLLVLAGDHYCDPQRVPHNLIVNHGDGYDGQFFYRFALNPFTHRQTEYGITLDSPAYRQQRIFYPLLTYLIDFGLPRNAARDLLLLNFAALLGIGYLAGRYAQEKRQHAAWGALIAINAGAYFTLLRDTAEILALFLALLALFLAHRRKYLLATLTLVTAMLTRETTLVVTGALLLELILSRFQARLGSASRDHQDKPVVPHGQEWALFLIPFAAYVLWQALLTHVWGIRPTASSGGRITFPFGGIRELLTTGGGANGAVNLPTTALQLFLIVFLLIITAGELKESRATFAEKTIWCIYALMGISYTYMIYIQDLGYMRIMVDFFGFSGLLLVSASNKARGQALLVLLAVCLLQAQALIFR